MIERLHETPYISVNCSVSFNIPCHVHLCLFGAVNSSKEENLIGSRAACTDVAEAICHTTLKSIKRYLLFVPYSEEEEETKAPLTSCQSVNAETVPEETNDDSTEAQDTVTGDDTAASDAKTQNEEHKVSEPKEEQHISDITEPSQSQEESQPISSPAEPPVEVEKKITYQKLVKEGRRFNIDLVSKVCIV